MIAVKSPMWVLDRAPHGVLSTPAMAWPTLLGTAEKPAGATAEPTRTAGSRTAGSRTAGAAGAGRPMRPAR